MYLIKTCLVFFIAAGLFWTTTADAIGMGGRFIRGIPRKQTAENTDIVPRILELWFGKIRTPAFNSGTCNDDDYVETTQIYRRVPDDVTKIAYNGSGCAANAASPNANHWVLSPGTYRITTTITQRASSSAACTIYIYGSADTSVDELVASAKTISVGNGSTVVFLTVPDGAVHNMVPWTNTCTAPDANVEMNIMIERLLVS